MSEVQGDGKKDGFALAKDSGTAGAVALVVDGAERDLAHVPGAGETIGFVTVDTDAGRYIVRHSTAHVLAQAVLRLFPGTKYSIGPPIVNGFYYDFDVDRPFTPEDLESIEAEMTKIVKENQRFERREISRQEGLELFADQPYKLEIIKGVDLGDEDAEKSDAAAVGGEVLSIYSNRGADAAEPAFVDLCRGPHLPSTSRIKAFKLLRTAGAYWRGDETKPMLQRIYGTAWESKQALEDHLHRLEEAEKRDHRKLGRDLELFTWDEQVGPAIALWLPKGAHVRQQLEDLIREMVLERGYQPVYTPHIGKSTLWETSGHLGFYKENMFPGMELEGAEYYLKPMNCPFHILIFKNKTRSYRDLPIRLAELGTVYRYERSGVLHGLLRGRGFTQDDSHIFCRPDQVVNEMVACVEFFRDLYATVGLGPDEVHFSTRPEKSVGTDDQWKLAEEAIVKAMENSGLEYKVAEGEGTFYGPKIDIHVRDAIGRLWQVATIQVDFQEPQRFEMEYVDEHGARVQPVMIHRALYGSIERFMGVITEHFAGAFPTWLAPVQVAMIPIADRHVGYADTVAGRLRKRGVRVDVDASDNTMGAKIRHHQMQKVPYMLVVGDNEESSETLSVRTRSGEEKRGVHVDLFEEDLVAEIVDRRV